MKDRLMRFVRFSLIAFCALAILQAPVLNAAVHSHARSQALIHAAYGSHLRAHPMVHSAYHSHAMVHSASHLRTHPLTRGVYHASYILPHHGTRLSSHLGYGYGSLNPAEGDQAQFDDPIVREAALDALGHVNGSILAVDPRDGRVLTIVNQKMAFSPGFEPCSTIKPVIAMAALQKGLINRDSMLPVGGRLSMDLTEALAHSNNAFFEQLGERLGFETVHEYASLFGIGEKAGYDLPGENAGTLPSEPPAHGGVARMSSFGEGIRITPLQMASMTSAVANGGTMFYLQYPQSQEDVNNFTPRVKRQLDIATQLPDLRDGMLGAVLYGTAKRSYDPDGAQALGKTGTCNDETVGGRLGWFTSYLDDANARIALVVLLRGYSGSISGPGAAEVAGRVYKELREHHYASPALPTDLASTLSPFAN
jgi:beta-lactamase class D